MPNVSRRFRVVGKVQGVYFRHSTRIEAERLNLAGFARNASDGSVEVLAHGPADAVAQLQEWLKSGPPSARVDQLSELELDLDTHAGEDAAPRSLTFDVL